MALAHLEVFFFSTLNIGEEKKKGQKGSQVMLFFPHFLSYNSFPQFEKTDGTTYAPLKIQSGITIRLRATEAEDLSEPLRTK